MMAAIAIDPIPFSDDLRAQRTSSAADCCVFCQSCGERLPAGFHRHCGPAGHDAAVHDEVVIMDETCLVEGVFSLKSSKSSYELADSASMFAVIVSTG